jgi:hypothetical protein
MGACDTEVAARRRAKAYTPVMRKRLATEIALVLCAKLAALTLLYFVFFASAAPVDTAAHLMGR